MTGNAKEFMIDPPLTDVRNAFLNALARKRMIIIVGNMEIIYRGRASSQIGRDDKILIVKEDKAVLIHGGRGYRPINWQPDTETIRTHLSDILKIEFIRRRPREILEVMIHKVYMFYSQKLLETHSLEMYLTEEQLKRLIVKNPHLVENGIRIIGEEVEIPDGKIDLLAKDKEGNTVVIELKKGRVGSNEVLQLNRYVEYYRRTNPATRGIIIGSSISSDAELLVNTLNLEFKRVNLRELAKRLGNT